MSDPSFHLIPADENKHLASWDCYCAPLQFEMDVLAWPCYRHQPAPEEKPMSDKSCINAGLHHLAQSCSCGYRPGVRGEGPCMDCGTLDTPVWFTDNVFWNHVVGGPGTQYDPGGFLCPWCFTQRAHAAGLSPTAWRLIPEFHWETVAERQARRDTPRA